ncbi:MAG: hypothetical protein HYW78_03975 [Parcubacteria group bacterium]|nr:hypothetical protein [Parcubacteria group bacterium]
MKKIYVVLVVFLLLGAVSQSRAQNLEKISKALDNLPKDILYKDEYVLVEETVPGKILSVTVLDFSGANYSLPNANPMKAIKLGIKKINQLNRYEIVDIKDINGEGQDASVTVGLLVFVKPKSDR